MLQTPPMNVRWAYGLAFFAVLAACGKLIGIDDRYYFPAVKDAQADDVEDGGVDTLDESSTDGSDAFVTDSGDASLTDSDDASVPETDAGLSLPPVEQEHLQLWLTADRGVMCINDEVTYWADQSGEHRDATRAGHLGPRCNAQFHSLAGVDLPYFSAPPQTSGPGLTDETLDVSLGFLAETDYTIFVVERRWADNTPSAGDEYLVGTTQDNAAPPSCLGAGFQVSLGYTYDDGYPALGFESVCYQPYSGIRGRVPNVASPPPSPPSFDMLRLWRDAGVSPTVWQNGVNIGVGAASGGIGRGFIGGAIGRALNGLLAETRFRGDIAELVMFDVALSEPERLLMEEYVREHWQLP